MYDIPVVVTIPGLMLQHYRLCEIRLPHSASMSKYEENLRQFWKTLKGLENDVPNILSSKINLNSFLCIL